MRQAVETAARKNLLRCVVCTPTLLEGVDFPTRTVIAAYLPADHGKPEIARLRGRADDALAEARALLAGVKPFDPIEVKRLAW